MQNNHTISEDRLLKIHEIAAEMHANEKTVYRRIRDGKLKVFKEGGRWMMWRILGFHQVQ